MYKLSHVIQTYRVTCRQLQNEVNNSTLGMKYLNILIMDTSTLMISIADLPRNGSLFHPVWSKISLIAMTKNPSKHMNLNGRSWEKREVGFYNSRRCILPDTMASYTFQRTSSLPTSTSSWHHLTQPGHIEFSCCPVTSLIKQDSSRC